MTDQKKLIKVSLIAVIIMITLFLHYFTVSDLKYHHAFYRMLFYLPLVLGSFWFGLKGSVCISLSVSLVYVPFVIRQWQGFSFEDFDKLLEGMLFVVIAFILGFLVEREMKKHKDLLQVKSLAAIGHALSEVAHDMKTPLVAIGGFVKQVQKKLHPNDLVTKKLDIVIRETARLESMVKGMLDFGRPIELQLGRANLNELTLETIEVVRVMATNFEVEIKEDLDSELPILNLDASKVKQIIFNLLTNAVQASRPGEEVLLKTKLNNEGAILEVIDNGCGIPDENSESIFHPFVSNKKGGAGLGLAIVKKIIEAHRGKISFQNNHKKGITFSVSFPS